MRVLGICLLLASLLIYALTVVRVPLEETPFFDLDPQPDAAEYLAGALSLSTQGTFTLPVAGLSLPPRYPFGYSVLMVPMLRAEVEPVKVPFLVNQAVGLGLILGMFAVLYTTASPLAAGLSTLLLVTLPLFIVLARSPMSDLSGGAIVLGSVSCWWRYMSDGGRRWALAGAGLLGVSVCFRLQNVMFAPVILLAPVLTIRTRATAMRDVAAAAVCFAFGVLPILVYNARHFGNPLSTGYEFWVGGHDFSSVFGGEYLRANLERLGNQFMVRRSPYQVEDIFGSNRGFGPAFVVLVLVSAVLAVRDRAFMVLGTVAAGVLIVMQFYRFEGTRFIFAVVLMSVPFAAVHTAFLLARLARGPRRHWLALACVLLLCGATVSGWPGSPGSRGPLTTAAFFDIGRLKGDAVNYEMVQRLGTLTKSKRTLILTDLHPPFVYALTSGDRIVAPLSRTYLPPHVTDTAPAARPGAQVVAALSSGREIYGLIMDGELAGLREAVPPPAGYVWRPLRPLRRQRGIAQLVATGR